MAFRRGTHIRAPSSWDGGWHKISAATGGGSIPGESPASLPACSTPDNKPRPKCFLPKIIYSTHFLVGSSTHHSCVTASHFCVVLPKPSGTPQHGKNSVPKAAWTLTHPHQSRDTTKADFSFSHPSLRPHHLHWPALSSLADGLRHPPAFLLVGASPGNLSGLHVGQVLKSSVLRQTARHGSGGWPAPSITGTRDRWTQPGGSQVLTLCGLWTGCWWRPRKALPE